MMKKNFIQQTAKRRVFFFLIFLAFFTIASAFLASRIKGSPLTSLVVMWSPALAAICASFLTRRSFKETGWGVRPVKWLAIGWLLPVIYGFLAYLPIWFLGLGSVPNPVFLERARLTLNMPSGSDLLVIVSAFGFITLVNLLPAMILSLGEEIGWRGFLIPELSKWGNLRSASLLSGVIWFLWHLPGILSGNYKSSGTPVVYQVLCFAIMVISGGVIFAWIRMKSGSIWPAAIMHATHNGVTQAFFDAITADTGRTHYFTGEFGIALAIVTSVFAWYCWQRMDKVVPVEDKISNVEVLVNA